MQPTGDFDVEVLQDKVKSPSSKRPLFLAALLGFAIAASLALIIGLSVGLTQGTLTPLSEAGLLDGDTTDDTQVAFSLSLVSRNWTEVLRRARGTSVRWWFWGLDAQINAFVDTTYGVALKQEFGITLVAVHLNNTFEAVDRVQVEYATGKTSDGSVDLIWLNGESFATMKKGGLLFGPFAEKLPLSRAVDLSNSALAFDFGLAVDNMESVWSQAQYQFVYLPSRTPTSLLPRSFADWINYAKANSGRLSYIFPNKGDFLAARFLKQALIELAPKHYLEGAFNRTRYNEISPLLWQSLNSVKSFLWQNGSAYPSTFADQDALFFQDQVDFTSTHDVAGAQTNIDDGKYPQGSKAYIWHTYSIGDFNYVAIPGNAANKPAALVLANLILRPDRQALQKIPAAGFGLGYGIDYNRLVPESRTLLDLGDQLLGDAHVPAQELAQYLVGDLTADYHNAIVDDWLTFVGENATATTNTAN